MLKTPILLYIKSTPLLVPIRLIHDGLSDFCRCWQRGAHIHYALSYHILCGPDLVDTSQEVQRGLLSGYPIDHAGGIYSQSLLLSRSQI